MYFLSVLAKEDFGFSPYYYGPFSSEVSDQLGALCEAGLVREQSVIYPEANVPFGELRRYDYELTEPGKQLAAHRSQALEKYRPFLKRINSHAVGNQARLVSTAAKVHFIVSEQGSVTTSDISQRASEVGWEIDLDQVNQVAGYLVELGLVRKGSR